jgi:hypothetical protein
MHARSACSRRIALLGAGLMCFPTSPLLAQWIHYRAPAVPRTAGGEVNLAAPAPKTADGKPDLSGVWESAPEYFYNLANDLKPDEVLMQPWAKALQEEREGKLHQDDPLSRCMPPGVPRIDMSTPDAPHPFKIVETPALVVLLYETSSNSTFRQVFLDGRPLPKDPQPTWLGYTIGHWEGATLVVETMGFNGFSWTDTAKGHPQTDAAHVIERLTRPDFGHLEIEITIDDPKAYLKPWRAKVPAHLLPDTDLIETYCENEKDQVHKR